MLSETWTSVSFSPSVLQSLAPFPWAFGAVWPCFSFSDVKPGISVNYHILLGEDMTHIRHIVLIYLWFQCVLDVKQGASDAAILGGSESSGRAGSHPVDFVFLRCPCGWQRGYFLWSAAVLGLRTFFVACQSFHPQPPGSSTTRSPLSDRRYSNHSGEHCGWWATALYWNEAISRPRWIFNLPEQLMFWKQSSLHRFIFPFTIWSKR